MIDTLNTVYNTTGILAVLVILFFCLIQVFDPRIKEGFLGCVCYLAMSTSAIAWLIHMFQGTYPQRTTITLLACMAVLMLRRLALSTPAWSRFVSWYIIKAKEAKAHNRSKQP